MIISEGYTISDISINECGSIDYWEDILNLNNLDTWTPYLTPGEEIKIPSTNNITYLNELKKYPAVNNLEIIDFTEQCDDIVLSLNSIVDYPAYQEPVNEPYILQVEIKRGESIVDISLNETGTIINWEDILNENNYDTWTPDLIPGNKIKIGYSEIQNNTLKNLIEYPSVNNLEITDFDIQVNELINTFVTNEYLFDDELTEYLFDDNGETFLYSN